jgi:hypothetical protein
MLPGKVLQQPSRYDKASKQKKLFSINCKLVDGNSKEVSV